MTREDLEKFKSTILGWITSAGGGSGPFAPSPHDLNGVHHSGNISDAQHGTRSTANAHAHSHLSGVTADQHHSQQHALDGPDHTGLLGASQLPATAIVETDAATATPQAVGASGATAGSGRKYARENHKHIVDLAMNAVWTGLHTFQALLKTRHIEPEAGELYDIGSVTKRYRTLRVAELAATLFSTDQIMILGNKIIVAKDAGTLAAAMTNVQTTCNFGKAMTVGEWAQISAEDTGGSPSTEWLLIGSLVSGTTYNVTRNVDGSGANAWTEGTPYVVIGADGDHRVEILAGNPVSVKIIQQGAAWNTVSEQLVLDNDGISVLAEDSVFIPKSAYKFMDIAGNILASFFATTYSGSFINAGIKTGAISEHDATAFLSAQVSTASKMSTAYMLADDAEFKLTSTFSRVRSAQSYLLAHKHSVVLPDISPGYLELTGAHYDLMGPMLSAPQCRGAWAMNSGMIGTGATVVVPDLSGQQRDLSVGGTVTFSSESNGNYPEYPVCSIAAGANNLARVDEAALAILDYFTFMGWFKFSNVNYATDSQFVVGQASVATNNVAWQWGMWIDHSYGSGLRRITLDMPNGTTRKHVEGASYLLENDKWYFLAGRYIASTEIALFVGGANGIFKHTNTSGIAAAMNNSTGQFRFFRRSDGSWQLQGGAAGPSAMYAKNLSDKTINAVFQSQRDYFEA